MKARKKEREAAERAASPDPQEAVLEQVTALEEAALPDPMHLCRPGKRTDARVFLCLSLCWRFRSSSSSCRGCSLRWRS